MIADPQDGYGKLSLPEREGGRERLSAGRPHNPDDDAGGPSDGPTGAPAVPRGRSTGSGSRELANHASADHAEQIAVGISEDDVVGVLGVLPLHPTRSQRDQAFDLGLQGVAVV